MTTRCPGASGNSLGQVRERRAGDSSRKLVGFWKSATRQEELRGQVFTFLTDLELVEFSRADVADAIMELAKANQSKLAGRTERASDHAARR